MAAVCDRDLLTMWSDAHALAPTLRAAAWIPGADRISVAARDANLLSLRERCFGSSLAGLAACPACGVRVEVTLDSSELAGTGAAGEGGSFTHDGYEVTWRMPTGADLYAIAGARDVEEGRRLLIDRCVVTSRCDGEDVPASALPAGIIAMLGVHTEGAGAAGDAEIAIRCPDCGTEWTVLFDAPSFFWSELQAAAAHLLDDIHLLAAAYGWTEDAILSLSRGRRAAYVERVAG